MRFEGKSGIVTGSGSGMGREVAHIVAAQGARVLILDRDGAAGERVAGEIVNAGGSAIFQLADVTREEEVATAIARCRAEFGALDFIHNNAGVQLEKPLTRRPSRNGIGSTT